MNTRTANLIITAQEVTEGAGVKVFRTIGTAALKNLDPFLMLDNFSTDNPDDYLAGFPMHPHRGFNTFTYMLDGLMQHKDSMGNEGTLEPGGAQWMKAASGIIHSEMPQQISGEMNGFQLWVNLPAARKMDNPGYQEIKKQDIPEIQENNTRIRLLAGRYANQTGPVTDPETNMHFMDITLPQNTPFSCPVKNTHHAFIYVFEGEVTIDHHTLASQQLATLTDGDHFSLLASSRTARFLFVSGKPIGEPIAQHGPFVMNTHEEIQQAITDYQQGQLAQKKAEMETLK